MMNWLTSKYGWLWLSLAIVSVGFGLLSMTFETVQLVTDVGDKVLASLGALFVVALFVERAQEVYISAWRGLERSEIELEVQQLTTGLVATRAATEAPDTNDPVAQARKAQALAHLPTQEKALRAVESNLLAYKHGTAKIAYLGGMALGIVIALVGPRLLSDIIVVHGDMGRLQAAIFYGIDILITGGMIGGGSEGVHKLVTLITDFLDRTRERVNTPATT